MEKQMENEMEAGFIYGVIVYNALMSKPKVLSGLPDDLWKLSSV